jgi:hypothetical protein
MSTHPGGAPDPERVGFTGTGPGAQDEVEDLLPGIQSVCAAQGLAPSRTADDGSSEEVLGGAVDGARRAWVLGRTKERDDGQVEASFTLHLVDGAAKRDWPIETHNPYFGVVVERLAWELSWVELVYREKHGRRRARVGFEGDVRVEPLGEA